MKFLVEQQGQNALVRIAAARLDSVSAPELARVFSTLESDGCTNILLDFESVTFVDSSGLGVVVAGLKAVGDDGEFVVCGVDGVVHDLFRLASLDDVIDIRGDTFDNLQRMVA